MITFCICVIVGISHYKSYMREHAILTLSLYGVRIWKVVYKTMVRRKVFIFLLPSRGGKPLVTYSLRPADFQILVCGGVLMGESQGDAPWDNI